MGDASLSAGDTCGGVEESRDEPRGAASSESTEGGNSQVIYVSKTNTLVVERCLEPAQL